MNFDFSDGQKQLQQTTRAFLDDRAPLQSCRRVLEAGTGWDPGLWKAVAQMGWLGTAVPEEFGGAGFGHLELALIAEEIGRALAPIPFAASVYLATQAILQGGTPEQTQRYLPRLVAGDLVGTLALAERPGHPGPADIDTVFARGRVRGTKIAVPDGAVAHLAVVGARMKGDFVLVLVDLEEAGVQRYKLDSIDPTHPSARLILTDAPAELLGGAAAGWDLLGRVLDGAAVLLAFEQLGGAQRALELTKDFTMERYAFGRPVASFQALKHRMVDVYVAIELARSNCLWGAWALSGEASDLGLAACSARISATRAFELAAVEMVQMHGGVGFTWEHDCHLFYRRAKHNAVVLGSAHHWRDTLVQRLVSQHAA
jgi:alkylation response protein AidB-like acyl-CoA dehydrogenase